MAEMSDLNRAFVRQYRDDAIEVALRVWVDADREELEAMTDDELVAWFAERQNVRRR